MNQTSSTGAQRPPAAVNEPVRAYLPGSPERASLRRRLTELAAQRIEAPSVIGGRDVRSTRVDPVSMPHDHGHVLADVHVAGPGEMSAAIDAAAAAWPAWSRAPWQERAAVFLRAAELLAGPWRDTVNAATMLGQSKTPHQAEIDAACELIDFLRFNVEWMLRIYGDQPSNSAGTWNRMDYRPLEGFVLAVTPFNFTSIAGNLPTSSALMGNTVVWKPAEKAAYSAHWLMELFRAAGLPDGVINLVHGHGAELVPVALAHRDLAGIHFTGSTPVFQSMWRTVAANLDGYRNYPRLVGETGGKNFVLVHPSADLDAVVAGVVRGGFEYQGQKCSAVSRLFVPASRWGALRASLEEEIGAIRMGDIRDFSNFMGAVIDRAAFTKHRDAIAEARQHPDTEVVCGGGTDDSTGWFVEPTLVLTRDPGFRLMREELFGPIVTTYVYEDRRWEETLDLVDGQTPYGLTGAVFATDRAPIEQALLRLRHAAGNVYVNDKPTGAVVGQQPFGGARASGTDDKAGSAWNLARWVSPRAIKENLAPPGDWRYPFLSSEP